VYIPNIQDRNLQFFQVDVTRIEREDDKIDKNYFYFDDSLMRQGFDIKVWTLGEYSGEVNLKGEPHGYGIWSKYDAP
jgi:hypothetical protein